MRCIGATGSYTMRTPGTVRDVGQIVPIDFGGCGFFRLWLPFPNPNTRPIIINFCVILRLRDVSITATRDRRLGRICESLLLIQGPLDKWRSYGIEDMMLS